MFFHAHPSIETMSGGRDDSEMEQGANDRFRVSIARVLAWVAILAVSLAVFRPRPPLALVLIAPLCWFVWAYDLARVLFPGFFRTRTLRDVLRGDFPMAQTLGVRQTPPGPLVPISPSGAFPWMTLDEMGRCDRALVEAGFGLPAAQFVLSALQKATAETSSAIDEGVTSEVGCGLRHTSAAELCASIRHYANSLAREGRGATALLGSLGLQRGEDVGRLVAALIELGLIVRREGESLDEFRGLRLLDEVPEAAGGPEDLSSGSRSDERRRGEAG